MASGADLHVAFATARPDLGGFLPSEEQERLAEKGPDREAATTAAVLVRQLLARVSGAGDHAWSRQCAVCGGPHGPAEPVGSGWRTSVSYGRIHVVAAVTEAGPVGIDLELDAATGFAGFADVALGPGEQDGTPGERARLWTRKEALLKAAGVGLTVDPRDVDATDPARGRWQPPGPVRWLDVPAPDGTTCSAAVLTTRRVRLFVS